MSDAVEAVHAQLVDIIRERDQERANHIRVNSALCAVIAEKNALRKALARYGCHLRGCAMVKAYQARGPEAPACDCGLSDALVAASPHPFAVEPTGEVGS